MEFHRYANLIEALLWLGFGVICAVRCKGAEPRARRLLVSLAVAFVAFGLSDVVESETGAWWEPVWLLLWKIACVVVLCIQGFRFFRIKRSRRDGSDRKN